MENTKLNLGNQPQAATGESVAQVEGEHKKEILRKVGKVGFEINQSGYQEYLKRNGKVATIDQTAFRKADEKIDQEVKDSVIKNINQASLRSVEEKGDGLGDLEDLLGIERKTIIDQPEEEPRSESAREIYFLHEPTPEQMATLPEIVERALTESEAIANKAHEEMLEYRKKSFEASGDEYKTLIHTQDVLEQHLIMLKKERSGRAVSDRSPEADRIRTINNVCKERIEHFSEKSPEAAYIKEGLEFREGVKEIQEGRLIQTPYVKEKIARVEANIQNGKPTLILGHLGCGKTEMALTAARESSIDLAAQKEAEKALAEKPEMQNASRKEQAEFLANEKRRNIKEINSKIREGDPGYVDKFTPLFISGSSDLTSQELLFDKTLKLDSKQEIEIANAQKEIDEEFLKWYSEHKYALDASKDGEKMAYEVRREISELYMQKHSAYGTVVKTVEKEILRGMKEGRPVIIDEGNAIKPAVLISLNDILQRGKAGNTISVPGLEEPIVVQEGFAIIMTGNETTSNVNYGGTNELNPAFRSRFDVMQYDYLPQSVVGGIENRQNPQNDELFRVVLSYLADSRHGNIQIPEKDKNLEKLYALSQLAKQTQKIFSGQQDDSRFYENIKGASGDEIDVQLDDSVLSLRNVVSVLAEWNKGAEKDLDVALWDAFVSGIGNPLEQRLIIQIAKNHGFFKESEGWGDVPEANRYISFDDIHPGKYRHQMTDLEIITEKEVLEMVFGEHTRLDYPDDIEFSLDDIELADTEMSNETIETIEGKMQLFQNEIDALEVLGEQCGCPNDGE